MRVAGIVAYHWRRNYKTIFVFLGILLAVSVGIAVYLKTQTVTQIRILPTGGFQVVQDGTYMRMDFDYSGLFTFFLAILSAMIMVRERKFLVAMSTSRYETLLGSVGFMITMALALTGLTWLIAMLSRLILCIMGFGVSGGWTFEMVMTAGRTDLWSGMLREFTSMIAEAGWLTLLVLVIMRWWKIILILCVAGIAGMVVVSVQVATGVMATTMMNWVQDTANWLVEVVIPYWTPIIESFYSEQNALIWAAREAVFGVVCYALCYPVSLKAKI